MRYENDLGGAPRRYADPIEFEAKVEEYFADCETRGKPPTLAGISYFLDFEDRDSFIRYGEYDGFSRTVKKAKLRIEAHRTENLVDRGTFTPGQIFDLKCNFGWREQESEAVDSFREFGIAVARALKAADDITTMIPEDDAEGDDAEVV